MLESSNKDQLKKKISQVKTFTVPFDLEGRQENIPLNLNTSSKPSKEQIINQAFKFHSQGNTPEAAKYYQLFINQGFEDHRVFSNYGSILKGLGQLKEAEVSTRKAIEIKADYADAHSNLGNILKDLGKLKEAEISIRKAIDLNPDLAEAHSNLGNVLKDLGKLKDAEVSTRKAIDLNPDLAEAHSNLGNVLKDLGKLKDAEVSTRKAIDLNPDLAEAHSNLGNVLKDLGKLKEAELSQRTAIELKPDLAEAHSNLGNVLKDLGKLKEAELSQRKAIKINPNFAMAYFNLANILIKFANQSEDTFKLQQTIIPLKKTIQLNPNFAEAFLLIGDILLGLDREKEAEKYIKKAIELDSHEPTNYTILGKVYNKLGKQKEAEELFRRAIKLDPKLESAHFNLGINYLIKNNLDCAIESFKTAQNIKPEEKLNQILIRFSEAKKSQEINSSNSSIIDERNQDQGLDNNPLILNRKVESELINSIYKIKNISHIRGGDPSFGDTEGSTYDFLDNDISIIKVLKKDLINILKDNLKRKIYIHTSFSTILGKSGGGLNKHNHVGSLDLLKGINLSKKKFSLVYYLSIGDQNCSEPGFLKLYEPEEKILPYEGMIITFPADRYHSVIYNGTKVRVAIVVNYYAI